jgi:hypothetical protein
VIGSFSSFLVIVKYPGDHLSCLLPQELRPFNAVSDLGLDFGNGEDPRVFSQWDIPDLILHCTSLPFVGVSRNRILRNHS